MGHPLRSDFNGGMQTGVGYMQVTIGNGRRCGAVEAFLAPIMDNPRLTLNTGLTVTRILTEKGRATGIQYYQSGRTKTACAHADVILTAGAFGTPKLLMLSGFGPATHLRHYGITVQSDLPGIGENLMDHHEVPVIAATNLHNGYFGEDRGFRMIRNGLQYFMFGKGPVATNGCEVWPLSIR